MIAFSTIDCSIIGGKSAERSPFGTLSETCSRSSIRTFRISRYALTRSTSRPRSVACSRICGNAARRYWIRFFCIVDARGGSVSIR